MEERRKTCCFTGHRPQKLTFKFDEEALACRQIKELLSQKIEKAIQEGFCRFITGMALGSDQWAAEAVLLLKVRYPHIALEAIIPCDNQAERWKTAHQTRYHYILSACDTITVLRDSYTAECMMERNRFMVGEADLIIAVWNGRPGGTAKTIEYAKKQGKQIDYVEVP